jgi:hypothetical protein
MYALLLASLLIQTAGAETATCPQTSQAWNNWRQQKISSLQTVDDLAAGAFDLLNSCQSDRDQQKFFKSPSFLSCMTPLMTASESVKLNMKDSVLNTPIFFGTPVSNKLPNDRPEVEELPEIFKNRAFVAASTDTTLTNDKVSALMKQVTAQYPGATIVQFKSRFGIGDKSILIRIPGPKVDRWIHMTWENEGLGQFLFMIGVEKEDATGKKLNPPKAFFNSFANTSMTDGVPPSPGTDDDKNPHKKMMKGVIITATSVRPVRVKTPQVSCYVCHRTGPMPIVPADDSIDPATNSVFKSPQISYTKGKNAAEAIGAFNDAIADTANAIPRGITAERFGPPMGPIDPASRTDDFVKSCFADPFPSKGSISNVKQSMNCVGCHNGDTAGKLTFPLGNNMIALSQFTPGSILHEMITSGHMPPGNQLTVDERSALATCVSKEYYGGFQGLFPGSQPGLYMKSLMPGKCPTVLLNEEANSQDKSKPSDANSASPLLSPALPSVVAPAQ